jgi:hypothetical protein
VAASPTATAPTKTKDYQAAFNYAGGAIPMCGKAQSATIEIGLDLTDFAPELKDGAGTFFLKVLQKSGSGVVNALTLMDYTSGAVKEIACTEKEKAMTATTLMSIPVTRGITPSIQKGNTRASMPANTLRATFNPALQIVRFSLPTTKSRSALLQIGDVCGRVVFTRAVTLGVSESVVWDLRSTRGIKAGQGTYFATLDCANQDGTVSRYAAKVMVVQ